MLDLLESTDGHATRRISIRQRSPVPGKPLGVLRVASQHANADGVAGALVPDVLGRSQLLPGCEAEVCKLDPEVGQDTRRVLMEEQARDGFTILMTSHNMSEIERLCRRVIFLAHGRAVADGTPAEIAARYGREDLEGTFLSIAEEARL